VQWISLSNGRCRSWTSLRQQGGTALRRSAYGRSTGPDKGTTKMCPRSGCEAPVGSLDGRQVPRRHEDTACPLAQRLERQHGGRFHRAISAWRPVRVGGLLEGVDTWRVQVTDVGNVRLILGVLGAPARGAVWQFRQAVRSSV
jgi:hypothetical protein